MRWFISVTVLLLVAVALSAQQSESGQSETQSRDLSSMFYTDTLPVTDSAAPHSTVKPATNAAARPKHPATTAGPAAAMQRRVGLKLRVLMHDAACNVQQVPATRVFQSGEQIRLQIEPNVDGYLSVLEKGSSGNESMLFPDPRINGGHNQVQRGIQYSIPPTGWFAFNDQPGEEQLLIIVSRKPLASLPKSAAQSQSPPAQMHATLSSLQQTVHARDLALFEEEAPQVATQPSSAQSLIALNTSNTENDTVYLQLTLKHR